MQPMSAGHRDAQALDMAARLTAAALEMRLQKNETLPIEVRTAIDRVIATVQGYDERIASIEGFQAALIREATSKLKGAA